MINELRKNAKIYAHASTIHGLPEISRSQDASEKWVWAILMALTFVICGTQLVKLLADVFQDEKIHTFSTLETIAAPKIEILNDRYALCASLPPVNVTGNVLVDVLVKAMVEDFVIVGSFGWQQCDRWLNSPVERGREVIQRYNLLGYDLLARSSAQLKKAADTNKAIKTAVKTANKTLRKLFKSKNSNGAGIQELYRLFYCGNNSKDDPIRNLQLAAYAVNGSQAGKIVKLQAIPSYGENSFGYKLNVTSHRMFPGWFAQLTVYGCAADQVYQLKIGSAFRHFSCSTRNTIFITAKSRTYNQRYCDPGLDKPCRINCLIQKARSYGACLWHVEYAEARRDIPYCGIESSRCEQKKLTEACGAECSTGCKAKPCTLCTSLVTQMTMQKSNVHQQQQNPSTNQGQNQDKPQADPENAPKSANLFLTVAEDFIIESIKVEPKYTFATTMSAVGGIMGIAFGMSILSIVQLCVFCAKVFYSSWRQKHNNKSGLDEEEKENVTRDREPGGRKKSYQTIGKN